MNRGAMKVVWGLKLLQKAVLATLCNKKDPNSSQSVELVTCDGT